MLFLEKTAPNAHTEEYDKRNHIALKEMILRINNQIAREIIEYHSDLEQCHFISLGPTCIAASILRFAHLRSCSFPFDWAQSGFLTLEEFLKREPDEFYLRNILTPSIHYDQVIVEGSSYHQIIDPLKRNHYGFPYFYNPHRPINCENRDYFMRCINRMKKILAEKGMIHFILADYPDQEGNTFLDKLVRNPLPLIDLLLNSVKSDFRVWIVRIMHTLDRSAMPQTLCSHARYVSTAYINMPSSFGRNEAPETDITGPLYGRLFLECLKSQRRIYSLAEAK